MSDINKKKLFIPRKLSYDDSRYSEWNNSQPIKDGKRINQYDSEGRKQGVWEERDDDDDDEIGQGLYLNSERIGVWEFYDTISNQIFAKGQYVDGYPDGIWEYYNPLNGELEGKSLFDNGKYIKKLPLTESKKLFIPRKLSGEGSRWSDWNKEQPIVDGVRINQYDSEGKRQGYWETYWENGNLHSKGLFKNGWRNGLWEYYYDNGKIMFKGSYKNGLKDGIWEEYHWIDGKLYLKDLFKDGENVKSLPITESEDKKKLFIPRKLSDDDSRYSEWNNKQPIVDGIKINQYDIDGRKQGIWYEYHYYGELFSKGSYINGREDGYWEFYYDNGELDCKGSYVNGLRDGIWEEYGWKNGKLIEKNLFKDGELVETLPINESKPPSFLLKEEMVLIREGNVQDYINNVISKIKNLPYETKKKYLTIAISTLLGYTSYPVIQSIFDKSPDKEAKEIVRRVMDKKDKVSMFNDGTKFRLSKKGFQHIMDEEKPKLIAYALGDGKITVGYGHAEPVATTKLKVGQKITKEQAKLYLKEDLKIAADGVRRMFRDWKKQNKNYKITQDMFDALVSMAFNMGVSGLRNTTFVDHLRDGNYKTAGKLIKQTKINNDSFPGLEKRRNRESDMFLSYLSQNNKINV